MTPGDPDGRGEQTRRRLLEATARVVVRSGWGGATTRRIADEAGVNPALVHYHFGTVDALLRETVRVTTTEMFGASMEALASVTDVRDAVRAMVEGLAGGAADDVTVLLYEALLAARRDPTLRAELAASLHDGRAVLAQWVRAVAPDRDADATAALLAAAFDGIYIHRLVDESVDPRIIAGPVGDLLGADADPPAHRRG